MKRMKILIMRISILGAIAGGCQQPVQKNVPPGDKPPTFYEDITWVSLMVDLPLLNDNNDRIPDGVLARVMLLRPGQPGYVAGKGTVIFHLMQRFRTPSGNSETRELHKWTISEEEFTRSVVRQRFGLISHQVALYWGNLNPKGRGIYLQAEFIRTDKQHIMSRPVGIVLSSSSPTGE